MSSKHLYFAMLGTIGILAIGLIGGAYLTDRLLQAASKQLLNNELQADALAQEQQQLAAAKKDIKQYQSLATIAKSVVPQDKDQAEAVQQIVNIANANSIALRAITFPTSTLGNASAKGNQQLSQLTPVKGISGVYDLQLTVQSDENNPVPYTRFISFLSDLEHNRRTALVNTVTIQPNDKNRSTLSFTLGLDEYIKP